MPTEIRDHFLPYRRITPNDGQYFFGYYDLQPFNLSEKYHLTHKAPFMDRLQVKGDRCEIGMIEMENGKYHTLTETGAWNFQQGSMLSWSFTDAENEIVYNDILDGDYVGVVMNIQTGKKRYLEKPVATLSPSGKHAISINFGRLYDFRPGYGYAEYPDPFYNENHSKDDGIFLIDMETGKAKLIISLDELWNFCGDHFAEDKKLNVNHITFNTDGTRFVFLLRNFPPPGGKHETALITANTDGSDMYMLYGWGVHSHYFWMDPETLMIYQARKEVPEGISTWNTFILKDKTQEMRVVADGIFRHDNHMVLTPDRKLSIHDTYPEADGNQWLRLYNEKTDICHRICAFPCPPLREMGHVDLRCDLHPRFDRSGKRLTVDSICEGFRGIYMVDIDPKEFD